MLLLLLRVVFQSSCFSGLSCNTVCFHKYFFLLSVVYIRLNIQMDVFLFYADSCCFCLWFASMNFRENQILQSDQYSYI